jgi:carlactone C-19 oxidase
VGRPDSHNRASSSSPTFHSLVLASLAVLVAAVLLRVLLSDVSSRCRNRHIPGPPAFPLVGHVPYLTQEPWAVFSRWADKFGPLYRLVVWNKLFVVVTDPAMVQEIFVTKRLKYPKDDWSYEFMR